MENLEPQDVTKIVDAVNECNTDTIDSTNTWIHDLADTGVSEQDRKTFRDLIDAIIKLPLADVINERRRITNTKKDLESTKKALIGASVIMQDPVSGEISAMNEASQSEISEYITSCGGIDKFIHDYQESMRSLERTRILISKIIDRYNDVLVSSSTFISASMVEGCTRRIRELEEKKSESNTSDSNADIDLKRMRTIAASYQDRTNMEPIFNKLRYINNIFNYMVEFMDTPIDDSLVEINRVFSSVFKDNNMTTFRKNFISLLDLDIHISPDEFGHLDAEDIMNDEKLKAVETTMFFITSWLARIYKSEYTNGKCAYVKSFIMNVYDACGTNPMLCDIPGGKELIAVTCKTIYLLITAISESSAQTKNVRNKTWIPQVYNPLKEEYEKEKARLIKEKPGANVPESTSLLSVIPDFDADEFFDEFIEYIEKIESDVVEEEPEGIPYESASDDVAEDS